MKGSRISPSLLECGHQKLKESLDHLAEALSGNTSFIEDRLPVSVGISFNLHNNPMSWVL